MVDRAGGEGRIVRSGDKAQYPAEPHVVSGNMGVLPKVTLLSMNHDPLGSIAAFAGIYSGRVVRSLSEITQPERMQSLVDMQKSHLKAGLEVVKLHFLIEGVDRAFTHQLVRQRTAVYGQESMRFAVLGDLLDATTLPPSLAGTVRDEEALGLGFPSSNPTQRQREIWDDAIRLLDSAYHQLVEGGIPAEEARGLLPHCTATRIHYVTDLRNLSDHAGNRLCTQAQFHWRLVFASIVAAIADYPSAEGKGVVREGSEWQFRAIAESGLFRPVCYQIRKCPFEASFDRACSIRERVQGQRWNEIQMEEWLLDPSAART